MHCQLLPLRVSGFVVAGAVLTSVLFAQFGTENVAERDMGRLPEAPFISFLGIAAPGKMANDPSLPLKGPVAEVLYEEVRAQTTRAGPAGEVVTSFRTKYDEAGRAIEEIQKGWGSAETITINRYEGSRLVSQETTFRNSNKPLPMSWNYWTYDRSGKLTDYRRGSGDEIQNHETNFRRNAQGRLTSFEYRQGAKDELSSRSEIRYASDGKTFDSTVYDETGKVTLSTTNSVDDQGRVERVIIRKLDWKTNKPKTPLKVGFRYDAKGRLLEQNTDAYEVEKTGGEQELPPGKVSITYDDVKRTRTASYVSSEGPLTSTVTYDANGAAIGTAFVTRDSNFQLDLACTYDSHDNWTTCNQMVKSSGVSRAGKLSRRTITYR